MAAPPPAVNLAEGFTQLKKYVVASVGVYVVGTFTIFVGLAEAVRVEKLDPLTWALVATGIIEAVPLVFLRKAFYTFYRFYRRRIYIAAAFVATLEVVAPPLLLLALTLIWVNPQPPHRIFLGLLALLSWPLGALRATFWFLTYRDLADDAEVDTFEKAGAAVFAAVFFVVLPLIWWLLTIAHLVLLYTAADRAQAAAEGP
ncbi:MAG: hypothetical protein QXP31_07755 [Pyrobaculum sp.]